MKQLINTVQFKTNFFHTILLFAAMIYSTVGLSQTEESFKQLIMPQSGMWWNSNQGGTGASMQFSRDGSWFIALFLYADDGEPLFYTLQGQSLEFSFDRTLFSNNAYAKATSLIYKATNGRCLGCQYQSPDVSIFENTSAEIFFFQKDRATIKLFDDENNIIYEENLANNLLANPILSTEYDTSKKVIHLLGNGYDETVVTKMFDAINPPTPPPGATDEPLFVFTCQLCSNENNTEELINSLEITTPISKALTGVKLTLSGQAYDFIIDPNSSIQTENQGKAGNIGISDIYGILDTQTAIAKGLPTQIIIQTAIH